MIAILGAGRLAAAIAPKLAPGVAVWSRKAVRARAIARGRRGIRAETKLEDALASARVVLFAVPDGAVAALAREVARARRSWRGVVVLHAAGAYGPELLGPLSARGAAAGVLHPLAALGVRGGTLAGASVRMEGAPAAMREARRIARKLGLLPLPSLSDRAAYHAAASLASNDVVALLLSARELLVGAGLERKAASAALIALAEGVLAIARRHGIEAALSGPVVRGDAKTLAFQLAVLDAADPAAAGAHRALSRRLVALSGLPTEAARAVTGALTRGRRRRRTV